MFSVLSVQRHDTRVEARFNQACVAVDASAHSVVVDSPRFGVVELGSSRAGVALAAGIVVDDLGSSRSAAEDQRAMRTVGEAIVAALRLAATRSEYGCPVDKHPHAGPWSPLAYSAEFLAHRWLVDDVERFLPCRVALAHAEDREQLDGSREEAAELVAPLVEWRKLYALDGDAKRPLTTTLAQFGDDVTPYALWGLRQVRLTRRAASAAHVEVLGALGRHPRAAQLRVHMELVERASVDELAQAIERVPRRALGVPDSVTAAHALPELLAIVDAADGVTSLRALLDLALQHVEMSQARMRSVALGHVLGTEKTALPPIPLPQIAGLRFLSTVGEVVAEGHAMKHCVATRQTMALAGAAFLFHVDTAHGPATVQLDADGFVVEARGLANADDEAARTAASLLAHWGRGFPGHKPAVVVERPSAIERAVGAARAVGLEGMMRRLLRSTVNPDF